MGNYYLDQRRYLQPPALCTMASQGPSSFTCPASALVSSTDDRSPTRTSRACGHAARASAARCAFRACRYTVCPLPARALAASEPTPSEEPVMKILAMFFACLYACLGGFFSAGDDWLPRVSRPK